MVVAIQVVGSFMAVLSFGLMLKMPREYPGWSGLTGGVCWLVYLVVKAGTGSMILGAFLSNLSVALMEHLFVKVFRTPVSVLLVPGILPLVPGTSICNNVYHVTRSSREEPMCYLVGTLRTVGTVVLAMFLVGSVSKLMGEKKRTEV